MLKLGELYIENEASEAVLAAASKIVALAAQGAPIRDADLPEELFQAALAKIAELAAEDAAGEPAAENALVAPPMPVVPPRKLRALRAAYAVKGSQRWRALVRLRATVPRGSGLLPTVAADDGGRDLRLMSDHYAELAQAAAPGSARRDELEGYRAWMDTALNLLYGPTEWWTSAALSLSVLAALAERIPLGQPLPSTTRDNEDRAPPGHLASIAPAAPNAPPTTHLCLPLRGRLVSSGV